VLFQNSDDLRAAASVNSSDKVAAFKKYWLTHHACLGRHCDSGKFKKGIREPDQTAPASLSFLEREQAAATQESRSVGIPPSKNLEDRLDQDQKIKPETPIINIPQIELHALCGMFD